MDEPEGGTNRAAEDPLREGMRIERVTRPDGRYLLYFAWPSDAGAEDPDGSRNVTITADDDV